MFTKLIKEVTDEIKSSNVRMSSNDDVIYTVEVIDKLLDIFRGFNVAYEIPPNTVEGESCGVIVGREHNTEDGTNCWCEPETIGDVIVHRRTDN